MGEDQLIEVFKSVGTVIGFRLVFDRDTGKPRGYGFCEFADHETAQSAVRNLNNADVGGRPLRIDLADSDPFLEGRTTVRGELMEGSDSGRGPERGRHDWLSSLPPGVSVPHGMSSMDVISRSLADMRPGQVLDLLAAMKSFVLNSPGMARELLSHNPQLACALFQALILNNIVDRSVVERMQAQAAATAAQNKPQPPPQAQQPLMQPRMPQVPPPAINPQLAQYQTPPQNYPPVNYGVPPQNPMYGQPPQAALPMPNYYQAPPPAATPASQQPQAMLVQVLQLTPEQLSTLPPSERAAVEQLVCRIVIRLFDPLF
ncbi:hypothetical protein SISSUDRAFT_1014333 [Sistotremastrum suecicum HHB10207 ss-3]|uniref:RRM domain-containing protein n=1 Tax=Sistotremastrum suecicum HHB10207 ss-3 TaxID=1314776 RepID=A0A166I3K3_9AGAM|nr:hypothetical protein SISSUDRAFT_1014333 [Sistotremastrum suecicum HHB10207 ss-3]